MPYGSLKSVLFTQNGAILLIVVLTVSPADIRKLTSISPVILDYAVDLVAAFVLVKNGPHATNKFKYIHSPAVLKV